MKNKILQSLVLLAFAFTAQVGEATERAVVHTTKAKVIKKNKRPKIPDTDKGNRAVHVTHQALHHPK